ncbi:MAG: signal peptide peptidase SppA [Cellvibrionaceae bacterium]
MANSKSGFLKRSFVTIGKVITWTRVVVLNVIFLFLLFIVIGALFGNKSKPLPSSAPLRIQINGSLVDQYSYIDPIAEIMAQGDGRNAETLVRDVVLAINTASKDDRISQLILDLGFFTGGGISKLEEIAQALEAFKKTSKEIIVMSDFYDQNQYFLASFADTVYMHPMGSVLLTGYGSFRNYYQAGIEKLHIDVHVFRVGGFKDAVEPFTRNNMSPESREHNTQWINELWSVYTSRVETQRGLPKDAINDYINNYDNYLNDVQGDAAQLAVNTKLVDELVTHSELMTRLYSAFGKNKKGDDYKAIDLDQYIAHLKRSPNLSKDAVSLIVASGTIYDGIQPPGNIGGDSLAQLIQQAREDSDTKAIVLRIDSGGGSAFASEIIRNELVATKNAGIPIIISMGSVAASGGYWISADADEIWATPTTLTGSIGVFAILPTFNKTLSELGISTDGIATTDLAGAMRIDMPMSPLTQNVLQHQVDNIYQRFINLVATGRSQEPESIHAIAQGRVWSGTAAQSYGLIDKLGYLNDAIASAAEKAGIEKYRIKVVEPQLSPFQQAVNSLSNQTIKMLAKAGLDKHIYRSSVIQSVRNSTQWKSFIDVIKLAKENGKKPTTFAHCMSCSEL